MISKQTSNYFITLFITWFLLFPSTAVLSSDFDTDFDLFDRPQETVVYDPLMPLNRGVFMFNDTLYVFVIRPTSKVYQFLVPKFLRTGVSNVFYTIKTPVRLVNHLLQFNMTATRLELSRFIVNTTFGIGGIMDPAKKWLHLPKQPNSFAQTLHTWGVGNGPYLVLPFLGPSTVRNSIGTVTDFALSPTTYMPNQTRTNALLLDKSNESPHLVKQIDKHRQASLDFYALARDAYYKKYIIRK